MGYNVFRNLVALVLLGAAGLKAQQLATEPVAGAGLLDSRWFHIAAVEFELFFGLLLLSGSLPKFTWFSALACFGLFAFVSLYKATLGHASCGCFGRVPVNPWYTATLDLAIVAALLRWRPKRQTPVLPFNIMRTRFRAMGVLVIWFVIGVPVAFTMGRYSPAIASDAGPISIGEGRIVLLSPESWIGKPFPLSAYVRDCPSELSSGLRPLREELTEGDWIVLLYHYDCPKCQEAIIKYKQLARDTATDTNSFRLALIEMPPYGDRKVMSLDTSYVHGQLSDKQEWFVAAPVLLRLARGLVVAASEGKRL